MASYKFDPARGMARVYFRFGGRQLTKVLRCSTEREAQRACMIVEETIQDVERGKLVIPDDADPKAFLLSGGKVAARVEAERRRATTLADLFDLYRADPPPHLEASTRKMQEIHFRRVLESAPVSLLAAFDAAAAQGYVGRRAKVMHRGRAIHRDTIAKELKSLRSAWAWVAAKTPGIAPPAWSLKTLVFPKGRAVRPFLSWEEVEREVGRGVLEDRQAESRRVDELWDCLWLDREQVRGLLDHVRGASAPPFLHPMAVAAAFTGARRSELCRSLVGDWDLAGGVGRLRQKKRDNEVEFSFRDVPLNPDLSAVLKAWFAEGHPGGERAFSQPDGSGVTWDSASYHLRETLSGSKWRVVKGWHVLRHSFASNLAAAGVDQRLIDRWMGHSTEIRWRYQHVRPDTARDAISHL